MASLDLQIYGRTYMVACDAGEEERVRALGRMVDERARTLGAASEAQRLLMVCLQLADELDEAKSGQGSVKAVASGEDDEVLVAAVEHLASRIDHIAASLA